MIATTGIALGSAIIVMAFGGSLPTGTGWRVASVGVALVLFDAGVRTSTRGSPQQACALAAAAAFAALSATPGVRVLLYAGIFLAACASALALLHRKGNAENGDG